MLDSGVHIMRSDVACLLFIHRVINDWTLLGGLNEVVAWRNELFEY